ncbi:hypothetical protein NDU88_010302 [Pleurodeles waltl]|uniref:Uncharacterized protein n=1 Tax=Pleurodeles waltl TaxID=8319 RepID=A0AAV7PXX4_PLEWA|nr:hypothetical protein NDU88_010302 [Pleurodeles waltl]
MAAAGETNGLVDICRYRSPQSRVYTHYSTVHDMHTRIEYWLVARALLASLLPGIVGQEQSGFTPVGSLSYNLRTLFGVISRIDPSVRVAAIFLDEEKAIDSVEWGFMEAVLLHIVVGDVFLKLLKV